MEPRYRLVPSPSRSLGGITRPRTAQIAAILKLDQAESLFCVYNEWVASRLAALLQAPLATGALAVDGALTGFASLQLVLDELPLPNIRRSQLTKACTLYGNLVAGLVVFDLWIGNFDRALNLKAAVSDLRRPLFCGFDHSHCLLTTERTISLSLTKLRQGDLIVGQHPFYGRAARTDVLRWIARLESLPSGLIRAACRSDERLSRVTPRVQSMLGTALARRASMLRSMVKDHAATLGLR